MATNFVAKLHTPFIVALAFQTNWSNISWEVFVATYTDIRRPFPCFCTCPKPVGLLQQSPD